MFAEDLPIMSPSIVTNGGAPAEEFHHQSFRGGVLWSSEELLQLFASSAFGSQEPPPFMIVDGPSSSVVGNPGEIAKSFSEPVQAAYDNASAEWVRVVVESKVEDQRGLV